MGFGTRWSDPGSGAWICGKVYKAGLGDDLTFSPQTVHSQPRDAGPATPGGSYVVPLPSLAHPLTSAWCSGVLIPLSSSQ